MAKFFDRNIDSRGRRARVLTGLILLIAAIIAALKIWWLGAILGVAALFTFFEAARGWCVMRACGIKTKL
jgi:hypothetical protein